MLDTVALSLNPHEVRIVDMDAFTPSARGILVPPYYPVRRGGMACHRNPSRADSEQFGYMPRLTLTKRPALAGFDVRLRVEFSAPKLLYGNNFDELTDADFPAVVARLVERLAHLGIFTTARVIEEAEVSAIHYGKNLPLTDYTRCGMVIREIAKASVSKQLDSTKTDYRNDGSAIRFHATRHEVIVYDKLKDLAKARASEKRSIEKDNAVQLSLLDAEFPKAFDILRVEGRIGNRQKLREVLEKHGINTPLTFRHLFSSAIARAVLLDYWRMMTPDVPLLAACHFAPEAIYDALYRDDPTARPAKLLQSVGAMAIIEREGMPALRARVERHADARTWLRMKKELAQLSVTAKLKYSAVQVAGQHLLAFEPLKIENYRQSRNDRAYSA